MCGFSIYWRSRFISLTIFLVRCIIISDNGGSLCYNEQEEMMNKKEVHNRVKKDFNGFFVSNGFFRQSSSLWIKKEKELIQIISLYFSYGQEEFNFDIAVQPFCIPSDNICLNISQRLSRFDKRSIVRFWGNYDEEKLIDDITDAENVFSQNVFPWFEKINDCNSLIKFLSSPEAGRSFHISPFSKAEILAWLYFYNHNFIRARLNAEKFISMSESHNDEYTKKTVNLMKEMIILSKTNTKELDNNFRKIIGDNLDMWKMKQ